MRRLVQAVAPPVVAVLFALAATCMVIAASGGSVAAFLTTIFSVPNDRVLVNIVNQSSLLAISGFAAAIGFRMGLFNIGVEGQYIVASCAAAFFGGSGLVPGALNIPATLLVAVLAGAGYASIAGILKVTRGVSEVISAIMLNYIALTMAGYLVQRYGEKAGYTFATRDLPPSSQPLGFAVLPGADDVWALTVVAGAVAVGYWFLLSRTRFGFDLRATGESPTAALASGVGVKKMVVISMALSGGVAGLVWMPAYFGSVHRFGVPENFQAGLGFAGLAVALLGRNKVLGILVGALLFAYLAGQSNELQREGIAKQVVDITQGVVVLAVVVAYEIVRRRASRAEREKVSEELSRTASSRPNGEVAR